MATKTKSSKRLSRAEKHDKKVKASNIKNHEALAFGLADLIAKNPRIEFEIVSNYLDRKHMRMVAETPEERAFADKITKEFEEKAKRGK